MSYFRVSFAQEIARAETYRSFRVFPCDVAKIGNEVGGNVDVTSYSTWLLNQLWHTKRR